MEINQSRFAKKDGCIKLLNSLQILTVIKDTLSEMGNKYASEDALMLVYRTGLVESKYQYIMQKGGNNIARGFWQCEPWVAVSLCNDYLQYRKDLLKKIAEICHLDWSYFTNPEEDKWRDILTTNLKAGIICCRLHYWRVPHPMPKTLEDQSSYWKRFYNSAHGSGTEEHFMEIVRKHG